MNAKGLILGLESAAGALGWDFVKNLVTNGSISQSELDGTREGLSAAAAALKKAPSERLEAMVAEYNDELTPYFDKFLLGGNRIHSAASGTPRSWWDTSR